MSPERSASDRPSLCFAHASYSLADEFASRDTGLSFVEVRTDEGLREHIANADVLVISGLWRNEYLALARRLRFIQSVSAGTDQYDIAALRARGVRLASAAGVNRIAVAEHAMALMLSLGRQLHIARDSQSRRVWSAGRPGRANRPVELAGSTVLIVGLGRVGSTIATLARGFGMHVVGVNRSTRSVEGVDVKDFSDLDSLIPRADFIVLTCALTAATRGLFDAGRFARMKRSAFLINVARGPVVAEAALIEALQHGRIRGAALDCFEQEPLPTTSPLWSMDDVVITAHLAGETPHYEARVVDILTENLRLLASGADRLTNEVVCNGR